MKYLNYRDDFIKACDEKAYRGYKEYSDKSFDRPIIELIHEMQEEVVDLAVWGNILWARLEELKKQVLKLEG